MHLYDTITKPSRRGTNLIQQVQTCLEESSLYSITSFSVLNVLKL